MCTPATVERGVVRDGGGGGYHELGSVSRERRVSMTTGGERSR